MYLSQKGFAQILALGGLLVLAASLAAGIYLVKQRTNVAPQAEDLRPITNVTGSAPSADASIPNFPFQIPEFIQNLVPTVVPPVPTKIEQPQPTTPAGAVLTPTPNPTLIPTFFPTPTITTVLTPTGKAEELNLSPTGASFVPISAPVPTIASLASLEGHYRVSFDSNFTTLIDTGDGGVFGSGNEKTINLTLVGGLGKKNVYIQFFENGRWVPETPIVASINLITSSADTSFTPMPSPRLILENQLPGGRRVPLYQLIEPPSTPTSSIPEIPNLSGTCEPGLETRLRQTREVMVRGDVSDWYELQWNLNNTGTCSGEGANAVNSLQTWIFNNKTGKQVGVGLYPGPGN